MSDYLQWQSDLSLETVFSSGNSVSYPMYFGQSTIYVTTLKEEKSRQALMLKSESGIDCITPQPFSLRTKVNEYGGKAFWLFSNQLFFVNQSDQCLYQQELVQKEGKVIAKKPVRVTPKPKDDCVFMFTDVTLIAGNKVLAIVEQSNPLDKTAENKCFIALIDFSETSQKIRLIEQGASFYSNLVYSEHSKRLAWVQWDHPSMPWDSTHAYVATLEVTNDTIGEKHQIPLQASASVCQLCFANNGNLFLSADFCSDYADERLGNNPNSDYWNVYCYQLETKEVIQVTNEKLEFGYPHWQYGDSRIVQLDASNLLTIGSSPEGDQLFLIDQESFHVTSVSNTNSTIQTLSSDRQGRALMVELPVNQSSKVLAFEDKKTVDVSDQLIACPLEGESNVGAFKDSVSIAEHIRFVCRDSQQAYGFYYPPSNVNYEASEESAPPLIVMVHGGPTARAYGHYDIQKQFWTSRGFALFDVNHRGSSGYGRRYRDALYGNWGELDCTDIIDGIQSLVDANKADAKRICIRGKSAGGYAVLRALTQYPDVFKAGACYYGIGNLSTLAQVTHKFEKHYTDRLIGETYSQDTAMQTTSRFYKRSPIHEIDQLKSAMIVFQGSLDNVVPPAVAHEVVSVLKRLELDHEYVEYSDEAHGFRQVVNNIDAWGRELAFYRRVLSDRTN